MELYMYYICLVVNILLDVDERYSQAHDHFVVKSLTFIPQIYSFILYFK